MSFPLQILLCIILFFVDFKGVGQIQLEIIEVDEYGKHLKIIERKSFSSEMKRERFLNQFFAHQYHDGYINATTDSTKIEGNIKTIYFSKGNFFKYAYLKQGNIENKLLRQIGYKEKFFSDKPASPQKLSLLIGSILSYFENHGYPFARIKISDLSIKNQAIRGELNLNKGNLIKIDSVIVKGSSELPKHIILKSLGIVKGSIYNQELLDQISTKIEQTANLHEIKPYEVLFSEGKTVLFLYLNKKKSNSFSGILGLFPDEITGKISFTGELNAQLNNSIKKGETFIFEWRRLINQTQNLHLGLGLPYLFKSPFSAKGNFKLYRRDTTFLSVTQDLGLTFHQKNNDQLSLEFQLYNTSLLNAKYINVSENNILEWADVQTISYGIGFTKNKLDYSPNPTRGFKIELHFGTGRKKIKENAELTSQNPDVYKNLELKSNQYNISLKGELFTPLFKVFALKTAISAGKTINSHIFINEMYRIGGLKTLRGFDEESIFATTFSILTFEYRFILEKNSAIFAFSDFSFYESFQKEKLFNDKPIGIGMGMDFETKAGIFSFVYALGKQFDNSFLLRSGKIHFGIKSTF